MKKLFLLSFCATAALGFFGCSSVNEVPDLGRFTIVSTKNVNFSKIGEMQRSPEKVATQSFNAKEMLIKANKLSDTYVLENALDSALEQIPGAVALTDAKIQYIHTKTFGKEQWGYKFEGTALIDNSVLGEANPSDIYFIYDEKSDKITFLDEKEFNTFCSKYEVSDL